MKEIFDKWNKFLIEKRMVSISNLLPADVEFAANFDNQVDLDLPPKDRQWAITVRRKSDGAIGAAFTDASGKVRLSFDNSYERLGKVEQYRKKAMANFSQIRKLYAEIMPLLTKQEKKYMESYDSFLDKKYNYDSISKEVDPFNPDSSIYMDYPSQKEYEKKFNAFMGKEGTDARKIFDPFLHGTPKNIEAQKKMADIYDNFLRLLGNLKEYHKSRITN